MYFDGNWLEKTQIKTKKEKEKEEQVKRLMNLKFKNVQQFVRIVATLHKQPDNQALLTLYDMNTKECSRLDELIDQLS